MKLFQAYYIFFFLSLRVVASEELGRYAKPGCKDTCGNSVRIPYPFGIGAECAVNDWYVVNCKSSTPYLHALNYPFEIVGVSLDNQTVTVNTPTVIFSDCQNPVTNITQTTNTIDRGRSPFWLSTLHNIFVFEGCGNAVMMDPGSNVLTGCSTACLINSTLSDSNCFGVSCCQTTIPRYLKSYNFRLIDFEKQGGDRGCGSAFVTDTSSYINRSFSNSQSSIASWEDTFVPITLLWTLSENDNDRVTCCPFNNKDKVIVQLGNGTSVDTWICRFLRDSYYKGNPYLEDGCYYDESAYWNDPVCAKCRANGGYCRSDDIYNIDGSVYKQEYSCRDDIYGYVYENRKSRLDLGVILGFSTIIIVLFLVVISYTMCKFIKKTKHKRQRKRIFSERNGAILLKQQAEADPSLIDKTILFTSRELVKASDNFNDNRILGQGGQGTVYKGMLVDGRIVAIKKSKFFDESQLEQFINEVVILLKSIIGMWSNYWDVA